MHFEIVRVKTIMCENPSTTTKEDDSDLKGSISGHLLDPNGALLLVPTVASYQAVVIVHMEELAIVEDSVGGSVPVGHVGLLGTVSFKDTCLVFKVSPGWFILWLSWM